MREEAPESEGVVDVWDSDDIPGSASQGTRLEGGKVVDKVSDDHICDFIREVAGGLVCVACHWRYIAEEAVDLGFASTPDDRDANREVYPYSTNGVEVKVVYEHR